MAVTARSDHTVIADEEMMEGVDQKKLKASNILLVHGAFADGSIWAHVVQNLQRRSFNVVASQLPLTSFAEDVRTVRRDLSALPGPTVVVGHSYGGFVITQATSKATNIVRTNIVSLVYIAAFAPDTGESINSIRAQYPPLPSERFLVPVDPTESPPFLILQRDKYHQFACQDVSQQTAGVLAAAEGPTSATILAEQIRGCPAWRQLPTWYQISSDDRMIQPAAQKVMAARATKSDHIISIPASHCSIVSHPEKVTAFIEQAAHTCVTTH